MRSPQRAEPIEPPKARRRTEPRVEPQPAASILDSRALQILTAGHGSLSSARALVYNEAFTRAGMFLAFLSTSFVALALVSQSLPSTDDFLLVAAIVLRRHPLERVERRIRYPPAPAITEATRMPILERANAGDSP